MANVSRITALNESRNRYFSTANTVQVLNSHEKLMALELLVTQQTVSELLQTFAALVIRFLPPCRMSYYWQTQSRRLLDLNYGHVVHEVALVDNHMQSLGVINYAFAEPLHSAQNEILQQLHKLLLNPLRALLKIEDLNQKTRIDFLTGIGNRAYFEESLKLSIEQNSRQHHGMTLMLLDLDHFKQINDLYGHPVGDSVLKSFADLLKGIIRSSDAVFRLGGDEFALLCQPANENTSRQIVERLQEKLSQNEVLKRWNTKCSVGHIDWCSGMSAEMIYELADEQLYIHKSKRRMAELD